MKRDMMMDIESLGNEGKFIVTSIALVSFSPYTGEIGMYKRVNIKLNEQINLGFNVSDETIKWWTQNDPVVLQSTLQSPVSIQSAIATIDQFMKNNEIDRVWTTATLDYQGVSNLCNAINVANPISYNMRMCARTVRALHENKFGPSERPVNNHDPIKDCENQIQVLVKQLNDLGLNM